MKALLFALIPLVVFGASVFFVQKDKSPEIVFSPEVIRPGYEPAPANYRVEASPHKKWHDYAEKNLILIIAGFLVSVGGTFGYIFLMQKQAKQGSNLILGILWLAGLILIFAGYVAFHSKVEYYTDLSPAAYEAAKANLDALFPIKK